MPQPLTPEQAQVYRAYQALSVDPRAMLPYYMPASDELKPEAARALCQAITKVVTNRQEMNTPMVRAS